MIYSLAGREKNSEKIKQSKPNIHMAFMGPAGTGKTEMARIMSEIFASLGYLDKGHLIEVDRSQLVGQHIGKTAPKVKEAVRKAMGGTLFIDEAYSLVGDEQDFGPEAIAALIKEMEDHKGEFMVILAGYQAEMEKLIDANEGFRSRIKQHFHFYDYTPEQISDIIQNILLDKGYICPDDVKKEITRAVKGKSKQGKVDGNARMARNMAEDIEEELNIRVGKDREQTLSNTHMITVEDVKRATDNQAKNQNRKELESIKKSSSDKLQNLIGLQDLKIQAQRILNTIVIDKLRYQNGLSTVKMNMHMVFYGPPGTGKTTVARIMGEFLKGAGVLSNGHFVEASRSELVAGYVGQTALKTKNIVSKAMGGILFIDEAYSLASDDNFGKEALDTLIKEMEDHANNLVVILAGYRESMEELMNLNEGLRSRIPYHFDFPHYSADELYHIALVQLKKNYGLIPNEEANKLLQLYILQKVEGNNGYIDGDGRWIRNLAQEIKTNQADRLTLLDQTEITIELLQEVTSEDIPKD
jgi:SpoVK/Ycf46/Vps4 family AAA+-type ATPase